MKDQALFRHSVFYLVLFFVLALVAFWPGYFSRIGQETDTRLHLHGIGMTLWCLMLIGQAWLIRVKKWKVHRWTGWLSVVLVPYILISTTALIHGQMEGSPAITTGHMYALALILNALLVFGILYVLAIVYRKQPGLHSRYMLATLFPMFTPVTDRLIYQFCRPILEWVPRIGRMPVVPAAGFLLADVILIGLIIWDWRSGRRWSPFAVALLILLPYHYSVLYFHQYDFWKAFCAWFVGV